MNGLIENMHVNILEIEKQTMKSSRLFPLLIRRNFERNFKRAFRIERFSNRKHSVIIPSKIYRKYLLWTLLRALTLSFKFRKLRIRTYIFNADIKH